MAFNDPYIDLAGLDPETIDALMQGSLATQRSGVLDSQQARADVLRNSKATGADVFSGLATVGNHVLGEMKSNRIDAERADIARRQAEAAKAWLASYYGKAKPTQTIHEDGWAAPIGTGEAGTDGRGF